MAFHKQHNILQKIAKKDRYKCLQYHRKIELFNIVTEYKIVYTIRTTEVFLI